MFPVTFGTESHPSCPSGALGNHFQQILSYYPYPINHSFQLILSLSLLLSIPALISTCQDIDWETLLFALANSIYSSSLCLNSGSDGVIHSPPPYSKGYRCLLSTYRVTSALCISASQMDCSLLPCPDLGRVGQKHPFIRLSVPFVSGFCSVRHGLALILHLCNLSISTQQMNMSIALPVMVNNTALPSSPNASTERLPTDSQDNWNETLNESKAVVS